MEILIKIGLGISTLISFVIPIGMFIYFIFKRRNMLKPFIIGILVFFISQIVLRLPLLSFVLPNQIWYIKLNSNPYLFSIFLGLTAGIFEEVGRYIGFKYFLKNNQTYIDGLVFGFGHWGIEALLLVGINAILLLFSPTLVDSLGVNITNAFAMGLERLFTMSIHIGFSMIVLYGIRRKKIIYLFIAILLHGVVDGLLGILPKIFNLDIIGIEIYVFIWSVVFLYLIYKFKGKFQSIDNKK